MHVISKQPFSEAARQRPDQRGALLALYYALSHKDARFTTPEQMRRVFPSLKRFLYRERWWVLEVDGGHLRLIACVHFQLDRLFVKHVVTHAEYERLCDRCRRRLS